MKMKNGIAAVGAAAGIAMAAAVAPGPALAGGPERFTESEHVHEIWGTCGIGDELVADYPVTETGTLFSSGRGTLHLKFVGTVTRSATGVVGKYSEKQRDFEFVDGSEKIVGLLGHLVVPGGGGFTVAGQARIGPDGTIISVTPGLQPLFELEQNFVQVVCDALTD